MNKTYSYAGDVADPTGGEINTPIDGMISDAVMAADYPRLEDKYYDLHGHANERLEFCEEDRQEFIVLKNKVRDIYSDADEEAQDAVNGKWYNPFD